MASFAVQLLLLWLGVAGRGHEISFLPRLKEAFVHLFILPVCQDLRKNELHWRRALGS